MDKIKLSIDGREVICEAGQTILTVCNENKIEIPTLCYDSRVEIYGSCGLCVVEVEGAPKLIRACQAVVSGGMIIKTNTQRVKKSRRTALELLLSDHTGDCRPPCMLACPGETDCQGYVGLIANGEYKEALKLIKEKLPLPASIGRVCPHPCEDACRRNLVEEPVGIAWLKSFVSDIDLKSDDVFMPEIKSETGKNISVIGGGPGGLTAAYFLRAKGHSVTIYDKMPEMGGMLRYGIPEYRLPKAVLDKEIAVIKNMGVKFVNNVNIGADVTLNTVRNLGDAVLVAIGAWRSMPLGCKGEGINGVIGGIDFLRESPMVEGRRVAVVGGGNTAMDACRTAVRLGAASVYNIYRRTRSEMPAEEIEITEAEEEGVIFKNLTNPVEITGDDWCVTKIVLQKMELGEPDSSGRRSPVPIPGAFETLDVDIVVIAIGQALDAKGFEAIERTGRGNFAADEKTFMTSLDGVFAVGDATNRGAGIAIEAIGEARKAAEVIDSFLNGEVIEYKKPFFVTAEASEDMFSGKQKQARSEMPHLKPGERKDSFAEVNLGYTKELAAREAGRCLECGCHDYFECKLIQYANDYGVYIGNFSGTERHHREQDLSHPFMFRNPDKCILCGLCVRICDEVVGRTALGLIDRGFDTSVVPELLKPWSETNCVSCGTCVSVCPTGAIGEKQPTGKSVPVKETITKTACSFCGVGCKINLSSKGRTLLRSMPDKEEGGILCVKGRFGFEEVLKRRITKPLIRRNGLLTETTFEEAYTFIWERLRELITGNNADTVGISVSDRLTNEEIFLLKKYAEKLRTKNIFSFSSAESGLKTVLGADRSTAGMCGILKADVILLIASDIINNHMIAGLKIKQEAENGAKLIVISPFETQADKWADLKINTDETLITLREFLKHIIDSGREPSNVCGLQELEESLKDVTVSDYVKEAADAYINAERPIILFEQNAVTHDASKLIADIAVMAGHTEGIIQLKPGCNSQGLSDTGIDNVPVNGLQSIIGLLVFGEDIPDHDLSSLEFLMVQDLFLTETAKKADVVLPLVSFAESGGTFTSSDGQTQSLNPAIKPLTDKANWEMFNELAGFSYTSLQDIQKHMPENAPPYAGKANLSVPFADMLLLKRQSTDAVIDRFTRRLEDEGLVRH